jgi:hypothetical protein
MEKKMRANMRWEFGLGNSTTQTICKNRTKIISVVEWIKNKVISKF